MAPSAYEQLVRTRMKKLREEYPQYRWPEAPLRDFAMRKIREELVGELNLPTFEEYRAQPSERLF